MKAQTNRLEVVVMEWGNRSGRLTANGRRTCKSLRDALRKRCGAAKVSIELTGLAPSPQARPEGRPGTARTDKSGVSSVLAVLSVPRTHLALIA